MCPTWPYRNALLQCAMMLGVRVLALWGSLTSYSTVGG
jgi:hypothetical protein